MKKLLAGLVIVSFVEIVCSLSLTFVREWLWNAIAQKQLNMFLTQLGYFLSLALVLVVVSGLYGYLINMCAIAWRHKITDKLVIHDSKIENYNQRKQQDTYSYPLLTLTLGFGLVKAIGYVIIFSVSLVATFSFNYLLVILCCISLGTLLAKKIAMPLTTLNYESQKNEATYRTELSQENFTLCQEILKAIAKRTKYLQYYQSLYGQIMVLLPILLIAPEFFNSAMLLGTLMRFTSTAGQIVESASYGLNSFGPINDWLSSRKRLKEILK